MLACNDARPTSPGQPCGNYPDWQTSDYVLPYPVGTAYRVDQGNCTGGGHQGRFRYSYDFDMPIGTRVTAARAGEVVRVVEHWPDTSTGLSEANLVQVLHADGTVAEYGHLTQGGAAVEVGNPVGPGDTIGFSGNSGFTGGFPHLHFHVAPCATCDTIPITFRNTDPNPEGLVEGQTYEARAE